MAMEEKPEIIKSNGEEVKVPKHFIRNLQKYLRLIPVIDPFYGYRVWIIAGK